MEKYNEIKKIKYINSIKLNIRYDLYKGTLEEWKKYAVAVLIFVFICFIFQVRVGKILTAEIRSDIGFTDYLLFTFRGMNIFSGNAIELQDKLPQWFLINIYLSIIIGYFPLRDLNQSGIQVLIRTKNRVQWWLCKCLWVIGNVFIYYSIAVIVILFLSIFTGGLHLTPSAEISLILSDLHIESFTSVQIIIVGLILPFLASVTLSLLQLIFSLYISSIVSNMIIIILLALTPFYCSSIIIGNYLMILRSSVTIGSNGVSAATGVIICLLLSIVIITLGSYKIRKIDILKK